MWVRGREGCENVWTSVPALSSALSPGLSLSLSWARRPSSLTVSSPDIFLWWQNGNCFHRLCEGSGGSGCDVTLWHFPVVPMWAINDRSNIVCSTDIIMEPLAGDFSYRGNLRRQHCLNSVLHSLTFDHAGYNKTCLKRRNCVSAHCSENHTGRYRWNDDIWNDHIFSTFMLVIFNPWWAKWQTILTKNRIWSAS